MSVSGMHLDTIDARLLHAHGGVTKLMRKLVNLVDRNGARRLARIGRTHKRGGNQARGARNVKSHVGRME